MPASTKLITSLLGGLGISCNCLGHTPNFSLYTFAARPLDFWSGANFKLRSKMVAGYVNYDTSSFDTPGALLDDDAQLEKIWKSEYSLKEVLDPKNFKSYDELKRKLEDVLGATLGNAEPSSTVEQTAVSSKPSFEPAKPRKSAADDVPFDTEDEDLNYFKGLADE